MRKMNTWLVGVERPSARSSAKKRRGSMSISVTLSLALEDAVEASVDQDVGVAIEAISEAEGVDVAPNQEGVVKVAIVVVVVDATAEIPPMLATRTLSQPLVARSCGLSITTKLESDNRATT